uniref:Uncharacterized protein n=1 Tax=Arundo donax TaxID=35708 RepID=A0A0A9C564_ARUDO
MDADKASQLTALHFGPFLIVSLRHSSFSSMALWHDPVNEFIYVLRPHPCLIIKTQSMTFHVYACLAGFFVL